MKNNIKNDNFYGLVIDEDKFRDTFCDGEYEQAMLMFRDKIGLTVKSSIKIIWDFDWGFMLVGYEFPVSVELEEIDSNIWERITKIFPTYTKRHYKIDTEYTIDNFADCCDTRWLNT